MCNKTFIQTPIYLVTHRYVKITLFINKIHMIEYIKIIKLNLYNMSQIVLYTNILEQISNWPPSFVIF